MKMERSIIPVPVVDKEGWRAVAIEDDFAVPAEVINRQAFIEREKMMRYVNTHPLRLYRYTVGGDEWEVDCKQNSYWVRRWMEAKRAELCDESQHAVP